MLKRNLSSMAMSLVEVIIGILLLVNPIGFTSGIIIAFGIVLMIMGIHKTVKYFRTEPEQAAVSQILVKGLLTLLAGAFCAFNSRWFIVTFPVLTLVYRRAYKPSRPLNRERKNSIFSCAELLP